MANIPVRITSRSQRLKPLKRNTGNLRNINKLPRTNLIQIPLRNDKQTTLNSSSREFVPSIVVTNVMSLTPKIDEIRVFTETFDIDLFFTSEIWLKDNVGDNHLILPGYNLERLDRKIGFHGGVCLYYNSGYKTTRLYNLECQNLEVMWVHVRPGRLPAEVFHV